MGEQRLNPLPVVEGERLRGLVRREDLINWLALHEGGEAVRLGEVPS
jgi:CBS domain-containing protein